MKAKVIRGVMIRGKAHAEGAVGSVGNEKQPGDAFLISHQEFNEMRAANYVVEHEEPKVEVKEEPKEEPKKVK
jgi:hypothetical protein